MKKKKKNKYKQEIHSMFEQVKQFHREGLEECQLMDIVDMNIELKND